MSNIARPLKSFGKFYVDRTILGLTGVGVIELFMMKILGKAKYAPLYISFVFGSTVMLVMGITGFVFTFALLGFQGTSEFTDTGLLASGILTGLAATIKLGMFFYIRQKEKKIRMWQQSLQALSSAVNVFVNTIAHELKKEQGQMITQVVEKHPEVLHVFNSLQQHDNHHLH